MKTKIIYSILFILLCVSVIAFNTKTEPTWNKYYELGKNEDALPSYRMFYLIETYSDSFGIPKHIAYNVAFKETTYRGPLDTTYNPYRTSNAGAVGAMQIMPRYASYFAGFPVSRKQVMHDLELNVWLSMKILAKHYGTYKNWSLACGAYNTGRPILNGYAKYCGSTKNFINQWVGPDSLKTQFSLAEL
jgi:soluble lytic murein transglycosylase-like protein